MFDFEEFGERSSYRRHLVASLVSVVIKDDGSVLCSRGWCITGYF